MRTLPESYVFSRGDAKDLGWTDSAISRALRAGRLVAPRRGQLTLPPHPIDDPYLECHQALIVAAEAAIRARSGSVISHHAAALVHGLPLLRQPSVIPTITVPPRRPQDGAKVRILRAALPAEDVICVAGLPVTSIARTLVDLGRWEPLPAAVVTIDAALHRHAVTPDEIDAVLLRCWNWPRIGRAARAVALADAGSESPLESVSRLVIAQLRLPTPTLQPEVISAKGLFIGRVDFYWNQVGVVGEADGAGKYGKSATSLIDEKRRQDALEDAGLVVTRWGWDEARRPNELQRRVTRAFERGIARNRSGLPREWSIR